MRDHFLQLADYNAWANRRIYAAAREIGAEARGRETGAYFGSLQGTLTHILVADHLWLARLQARPAPHARLDETPTADFEALWTARQQQDDAVRALIAALDDAAIADAFAYTDMSGTSRTLPRRIILTHMFNHATHHRGQAHHQLSQLGLAEPPPLDLPYFVLDLV
ncbi:DinB family protein [Maricaulis sp.]|uniref:DinB family protein n=1 Tax=Maricaulis sp. TaxID=1486257 RepID=UPI002B26F3D2|nr:DinB family protein [Maricaulis sp.]